MRASIAHYIAHIYACIYLCSMHALTIRTHTHTHSGLWERIGRVVNRHIQAHIILFHDSLMNCAILRSTRTIHTHTHTVAQRRACERIPRVRVHVACVYLRILMYTMCTTQCPPKTHLRFYERPNATRIGTRANAHTNTFWARLHATRVNEFNGSGSLIHKPTQTTI